MVGLDLDIFGNETPYLFLFNFFLSLFRILIRGAQFLFLFLAFLLFI